MIMTTEQQPVITNSGGSNSNASNLNHQRKASGRNTSSRHSSACGGGQWYANGEPGGMQFVPPEMPLGFAPPLLATGFYAQPPGALFDYSAMLNSPDMNAWAAASDMQHILSGTPIYDPVYSGGFLSPTLVNPAAFTPVNGPTFAYDANELYSACGMTPTPTGVPNFPFDPSLNLAAAPWDGFAAPAGDYATWQASNGAHVAVPDSQLLLSAAVSSQDAGGNVNGASSQVGESAAASEGEVTVAAARPTHSSATGRSVEHVTGQMTLLRVANANSNGATASYAAALLSKQPATTTSNSNDPSASKLDASDQAAIDAALFKPAGEEPVSKGKFLSVAKRREVTYAGVVKSGANETNDAKSPSASASASNATQNVNGFASSPFVAPFGTGRTPGNGVPAPVAATATSPWLTSGEDSPEVLLERLKASVNPCSFEVTPGSRFFVIKSYSEDDVHRSIKYGIWCSTVPGNQKLDAAYRAVNALADRRDSRDAKNSANAIVNANVAANIAPKTVVGLTYPINQSQQQKGSKNQCDKQSDCKNALKEQSQPGVFLFFSVNGSGHFCGVAEMASTVDYETRAGVWEQDKWRGKLDVRWHFVKDVPNAALRNVRLENNENKPVTNSRDTQEVPIDKARQVLQVFATYPHTTSLFDDFLHYEQKQLNSTRARSNPSANWNGAPHAQAHAHAHAWRSAADDWNASASAQSQAQPQPQTTAEWYPASVRADWHSHSNSWGTKGSTARSADWHAAVGNDETQSAAFAFGYLPAATRPDAPSS